MKAWNRSFLKEALDPTRVLDFTVQRRACRRSVEKHGGIASIDLEIVIGQQISASLQFSAGVQPTLEHWLGRRQWLQGREAAPLSNKRSELPSLAYCRLALA